MKRMSRVLTWLCCLAAATNAFAQYPGSMPVQTGPFDQFGFKLLAQTRQSVPGKNVFLSPLGLAFALSMAADGARGRTLQQMLAALQSDSGAGLNAHNLGLLTTLSSLNGDVTLEIANSLWTAQDAAIKNAYLADNRQFYNAGVANVDFGNPATANQINGWVSDQTHGKITKMVQPPLNDNRVILLDAIYFKGDWKEPFDRKLTHDAPFTLGSGQSITHPRMSRTGKFDYFENDLFQAVRLPYKGGVISMYVFLPKKSLADFLQNLNAETWRTWQAHFERRKGALEMPRFKLENEYNLKPVLESMGMTAAFSREADFHGIADEPLYINWVKQKTYVEVNEEGTVAAAVSGIGIAALAVRMEPPPFQMIVDRPFFVIISDNLTRGLLFIGAIEDPRS
jgi:serpin B